MAPLLVVGLCRGWNTDCFVFLGLGVVPRNVCECQIRNVNFFFSEISDGGKDGGDEAGGGGRGER